MACLAKSSLLVHGTATRHPLMCGSQPRLPSADTDAPPAHCSVSCTGDIYLQQTFRRLGSSRVAFLQAESDHSLQRAILQKTRLPGFSQWVSGSLFRYCHTVVSAATIGWRGPTVVRSETRRHVLLRNGGQWLTIDTGAIMATDAHTDYLVAEAAPAPPFPTPPADHRTTVFQTW